MLGRQTSVLGRWPTQATGVCEVVRCRAVTPLFTVECGCRTGMLDYGTRVALLRLLRKFRTGGKDNENQGQRERVVDGSCAGFVRAGRWNWSSAPDSGKRRSGVGCQWWRADSAVAVDEWRCTDPAIALEQIAAWSCRRMNQGVDDSELLHYSGAKPCGASSKLRVRQS